MITQSEKAATVDHVRTRLALEAQGGENVIKVPQWQLKRCEPSWQWRVWSGAQRWLGAEVAVRTIDLPDEATQSTSATKSAQVRLCARLLLHSDCKFAQMCQHCRTGFCVAGDPHARGRVFDDVSASSCDSVVWCGC